MSPKDTQLPLESFTIDQWAEWIGSQLHLKKASPQIPSSGRQELHQTLINVHKELEDKASKERFRKAVSLVFESTQALRENAEEIYYLLQVISYLKPLRAKRLIRRHLFEEILRNVAYGGQELHTMLLVAYSKYDIDDELLDYILRSARDRRAEYSYLLVCFRILSQRNGEEAISFLETLFPYLVSKQNVAQMVRVIRGIIFRTGYRPLFEWYENEFRRCLQQWPVEAASFREALRVSILPWGSKADEKRDSYGILLSSLLNTGFHRFTPSDLLCITGLVRSVSEKVIRRVLNAIWEGSASKWSHETPWQVNCPPPDFRNRVSLNPRQCFIENALGSVQLDTENDNGALLLLTRATPRAMSAGAGAGTTTRG